MAATPARTPTILDLMDCMPARDFVPTAPPRPARLAAAMLAALLLSISGGCSSELDWPDSVALTPSDHWAGALVEAADARWEAAGVHSDVIRIVPRGGLPVGWQPVGTSMAEACRLPEAHNVCGCIAMKGGSGPTHIWLNRMCGNLNVVAHELGHLMAQRRSHLGAEHGCSQPDARVIRAPHLMCGHVGEAITAADLELVCAAAICTGFEPE